MNELIEVNIKFSWCKTMDKISPSRKSWLTRFLNFEPGTYGIVIIGLFVVLLVGSLCFAIYIYIIRRRKFKGLKRLSSQHKYAIVEQNPDNPVKTRQNQIQPPTQVKVKLVPSPVQFPPHRPISRTRKKMIRYSEIDEEGNEEEEEQIANSFQKSIRNYKYKIVELLSGRNSLNENEDLSQPCIVAVNDNKSFKRSSSLRRLRRANSSIQIDNGINMGQLIFYLLFSSSEEFLTVNLLSGRQLHSPDPEFNVNLPVVSIQIEGLPDTEVTSTPDEAPNPEYDQEFTFDGMSVEKLNTSVLRFIILDIISPHGHETRVVGFFYVELKHFHKLLIEKGDSGEIRRDVSLYVSEEVKDCAGELLLSLMYDCVTDRIVVTVRKLKGVMLQQIDVDLHIKVSLLLDNDIIQSKRSTAFQPASNITVNQTFEFNALSADLELLTNTTEFSKMSLELKDKEIEIKSTSSETLRHNMGVRCSIIATTTNRMKRFVGTLNVGKTDTSSKDEQFHWNEMVRHFDNTITQWHVLKFSD